MRNITSVLFILIFSYTHFTSIHCSASGEIGRNSASSSAYQKQSIRLTFMRIQDKISGRSTPPYDAYDEIDDKQFPTTQSSHLSWSKKLAKTNVLAIAEEQEQVTIYVNEQCQPLSLKEQKASPQNKKRCCCILQ